jgi:hypothetical protein
MDSPLYRGAYTDYTCAGVVLDSAPLSFNRVHIYLEHLVVEHFLAWNSGDISNISFFERDERRYRRQ